MYNVIHNPLTMRDADIAQGLGMLDMSLFHAPDKEICGAHLKHLELMYPPERQFKLLSPAGSSGWAVGYGRMQTIAKICWYSTNLTSPGEITRCLRTQLHSLLTMM